MNKLKPIRHGEIILMPVDKLPKGKVKQATNYIVGHSETGHHHVLESDVKFDVLILDDVFVHLHEAAELVHKKEVDRHKTLPVAPGTYHVIYKNEYDPFSKILRRVED